MSVTQVGVSTTAQMFGRSENGQLRPGDSIEFSMENGDIWVGRVTQISSLSWRADVWLHREAGEEVSRCACGRGR